ncbi:KICSTOR complex protein SZT2 isoform X2 [Nasonia vitripennis]|uniref:Protein SZT2 n=1 Tax=Nasonia vitripennis TaxID=7425 RepID=A0A7M7QHW4_NASVI|nr:KICSTOR complex protein SZT2 isoform X2 [Nasonia vitripennis]
MDCSENEKPTVLEADTVYLLMKKGFPISRNVRAQWVLQHLDTVIAVQNPALDCEESPDLEIVSVLPKDGIDSWCPENSYQFLYKVTSSTTIKFLAHRYRMVFSLDLSPSLAAVDIQHGEIVIDEVFTSTKRFLEGLTRPFVVPGSKRVIHPEIYVTVIVHTPFFTNPAQQVLVQGWLVTKENVASLMQTIETQLNLLEEKVAQVTSLVNLQLETLRAESERLVGGLFEEGGTSIGKSNLNNNVSTIAMVLPETGFVNMLRYGMLALSLLPEHSCAHLVIVTDGIVGVNDVHALESIIQQLRATTVACSFLHVGSSYRPNSANGLVPYPDLLRFFATATLGSYMTVFPATVATEEMDMNKYHIELLCWQLYRTNHAEVASVGPNAWHTKNSLFYGHEPPQLLRKKQIDDQVTCTLNSLLCCRLREGYLIKKTAIRDGCLEICFVLPWKTHVYVEYVVTCPRFLKSLSVCNTLQYTITIEAPYEFLHDITCLSKKPLKSQYRQNMVSRFWSALTSLTESDSMLVHFSWFPGMGWTWYNVPDTIRSGMPLFYLPTSSSSSIQLSDAACPQFGQIWQPVVSLEPHQWPRWLHSQRVTLILLHDRPLSKHLHQANQSGRFQSVQYRQAAAVLYGMLKTWATFVLVENHTYVQFIHKEADKPPISFSLINISCKALCVVLNVAFAGGTEGVVRHNVMTDLLERLSQLTLPSRRTEQREVPCCIILHKALEKILIRYERMPIDLSTVIFPDGSQIISRNASIAGGSLTTTLSRYLYHARWLWLLKKPSLQTVPVITLPRLNVAAVARILSTITKIRLAEGFNFAYSAAGIINTVMEVQMKGPGSDDISYPCIVQYILFPPHVIVGPGGLEKESGSDEETDEGTADGENGIEDTETSGDFQIVMEVWIEPQCGYVQTTAAKKAAYMHFLEYHQLPEAISKIDKECINALLTLEHLSMMCQVSPLDKSHDLPGNQQQLQSSGLPTNQTSNNNNNNNNGLNHGKTSRRPTYADILENPLVDDRIRPMQFDFDALGILPKCQQAELLFSMFADDYHDQLHGDNNANRILMDGLLNHIKSLHNKELILSAAESDRFTKMLLERPREDGARPQFCHYETSLLGSKGVLYPRWRCFIKGISVTHVIVTLLPAAESDVQLMSHPDEDVDRHVLTTPVFSQQPDESTSEHIEYKQLYGDAETSQSGDTSPVQRNRAETAESTDMEYLKNALAFSTPKATDMFDKTPVTASASADGTSRRGLVLPVYVYDCSLALLIDALIEKHEKPRFKDIYRDHTYRVSDNFREEFVNLKSGDNTKPSSPEPKSEDSDNVSSDQRNLMEHCKVLSLAHCNSYVVAVYKSLILQQSISYDDIDAAVEQCEEFLMEINITDYLKAVCRHLSPQDEHDAESPCSEMRNIHNLIKDKFRKIINVAFKQVPVHPDFYYCLPAWKSCDELADAATQASSDSDDDVRFTFNSEAINGKIGNSLKKVNHISSMPWTGGSLIGHERFVLSECSDSADSFGSDLQTDPEHSREQPLFLQLNCSIHSKSSFSTTAVKLLPTCFTEVTQKLEDFNLKDTSSLKVTLDIICLNLPKDVLEVSIDNTPAGLRTTSYCSEGSMTRADTNESSFDRLQSVEADHIYDGLNKMPRHQGNAVSNLVDEINWLLRDETAAVLLDKPSPTEDTLNFVAKHVAESNNRASCYLDKVPLHFVFSSDNSLPRFVEELKKLKIDRYCIKQEGGFFYFVKNSTDEMASDADRVSLSDFHTKQDRKGFELNSSSVFNSDDFPIATSSRVKKQDSGDPPGCHSEISSIGDNQIGTDDGYEGDSSDSEDECQWLIDLDRRRELLPNFWLILHVENNHVNVYFHCRFLELTSPEVDRYQQVQKTAVARIKAICRRVNQYLLLRDLHDKRICDPLLEPESIEDHSWKSAENNADSSASATHNQSTSNSSVTRSNVSPGMFRCPIVWEVPFCLHHRLKTGPGKTGLSRGIKALQAVLNRFSVNNRSNMFVYQESNGNVFYLRLHERTSDDRPLQSSKLSESDEKLIVSRSSSIASLSQAKSLGVSVDLNSSSSTSTMDLLRPRVRSFGERESDILNKSGDSIVLMVHGISEAGPEVRYELVQVLQNRLDDAVLEVLSVMLARNPMCKLTPSDVHFIQRQYRVPESVIRLSVQQRCLRHMGALGYYLRQNILQFLYTPKYTDTRAHSHFQDYSQQDGSNKRVPESDIFLYNQSHSSGSRGIACIAIAIVNEKGDIIVTENENVFDSMFPSCPEIKDFEDIVATNVYWGLNCEKNDSKSGTKAYIEFRIWKQGRVNLEALVHKLKAAVKHANWDLITEYNFLPTPLTESFNDENDTDDHNIRNDPSELNSYELGEKGKLKEVYHTTLPYWFQFALDLAAPSMKKHIVKLERRHSLPVILKELQNLVHSHALDTTARTFVQWSRQPFIGTDSTQDDLLLSKTIENVEGSIKWLQKAIEQKTADDLIFLPRDATKEDQGTYVRSILIARNFNQWKASFSSTILSEQLIPKDQKLLQKFNPLILEKTFVPRQRLLLAKVQSEHILLYMYNWSKERSEKLIKQVSSLGLWLSSRSNLYSNIIMQKLGIFHHQPVRNYEQEEQTGQQFYQITDMESLSKFPNGTQADSKEWQRVNLRGQSGKNMVFSWNQLMGQVMRDAKPSGQYPANTTDPVVKAAYDFQELRHKEKKSKDDLNKLHTMWQSRGAVPNIPISVATLNTFKQHSRLIHYCHTPLLFLPSWRLESAATRDHSLTPPPFNLAVNSQQRSRTTSDASNKRIISKWHKEICELMLAEYKQYLQVLGFNPIQIETQNKTDGENILNQAFYLKKSMLGGVLLFEIHLAEPFFVVKLRVIECSRLQAKSSSALVNQFMLSFVDACDKIKISMHLHSFTYDFHLRCIHSYISGNCHWSLRHGYHLTNFLDDFNKYYSKAPNYARNLIYSGVVTVSNLVTPAQTLYQYLLSHEKTYGMQVFSMADETDDTQHSEYVLVKLQSTPLVSYHDSQDTKYTDDFDVALIVTWTEQFARCDSREITLKYYLMLTSKRELHPKREVENNNKIGKFRTVYSVVKSIASSQMDSPSESSPSSMTSPYLHKQTKSELVSSSSDLHAEDTNAAESLGSLRECDGLDSEDPENDVRSPLAPTPPPVPDSPLATNVLNASTASSSNLTQIRQESINYLGYYSSHEQLMQQLIMSQASAAQQHIKNMIEQGALHCRTHLLWNRLLESRSSMTYAEFAELRSLACVEPLSRIDPRLSPLINQPIGWYQALAKLLQNKYQEYHKQFNAPDGNVMHHLILHPNYVQAFMMLTIDLHTSRGELYAVYRKSEEITSTPFTIGDIYSLIEDFVNACCFHLWVGLYS